MSRKKTKPKKLFYKAGKKGTVVDEQKHINV